MIPEQLQNDFLLSRRAKWFYLDLYFAVYSSQKPLDTKWVCKMIPDIVKRWSHTKSQRVYFRFWICCLPLSKPWMICKIITDAIKRSSQHKQNLKGFISDLEFAFFPSPNLSRYEMIRKMIPENQQKMLHNIKKTQERTKRHKALNAASRQGDQEGEEEEDEEGFDALVPQKPKPERSEQAW